MARARPEGRPADRGRRSKRFSFLSRDAKLRDKEDIMNNAFLALDGRRIGGFGWLRDQRSNHPGANRSKLLTSAPDYSQEAGVFSQWLSPDAPQCVAVSKIGSVSHLTKLTRAAISVCARALHRHSADLASASSRRQRSGRERERPVDDRACFGWRNLRALSCARFRLVDADPSRQRRSLAAGDPI